MSDFDNEKTGGQERPDYYQPNQNEGQTYYTPPQNEQADNNTTYHYSYAGKAQENIQAVTATIINRRKMIISKTQKTAIRQSRLRRNPVPAK